MLKDAKGSWVVFLAFVANKIPAQNAPKGEQEGLF